MSNEYLEITESYLMKNRTNKKSWTRSQFEALGVEWPPNKGWKSRVIGLTISPEQQKIFEAKLSANQDKPNINEKKKITAAIKLLKSKGYNVFRNGFKI